MFYKDDERVKRNNKYSNIIIFYKKFHLMCFIMKTDILYTRVQWSERDNDAVFLFPCCIAAGCSPETKLAELAGALQSGFSVWRLFVSLIARLR